MPKGKSESVDKRVRFKAAADDIVQFHKGLRQFARMKLAVDHKWLAGKLTEFEQAYDALRTDLAPYLTKPK